MGRSRDKKQQLIKELEEYPLVTFVCKRLNIARATYYRWRDEDIAFKIDTDLAQKRGRAKYNDYSESKLLENVRKGVHQAIIYWLSHNHSGYRNPTVKVYLEQNETLRLELLHLQGALTQMINLLGLDELIKAQGEDPEILKKRLKKQLDEQRKRTGEL